MTTYEITYFCGQDQMQINDIVEAEILDGKVSRLRRLGATYENGEFASDFADDWDRTCALNKAKAAVLCLEGGETWFCD